jgi:hypothetical protein
MKKYILSVLVLYTCLQAHAQDDLLGSLGSDDKAYPVNATFKSNRLVNGHTTETTAKNHLDFKIHHRFGRLNTGPYEFFGLDQANMMLGFEYGLSNKFTIGITRNTYQKLYTGHIKYKLMTQTGKGKNSRPLSISFLSNIGAISLKWADPSRINYFSSRLSYVNQLLIARKVNKNVSLQLMPTMYHQNLVDKATDPNDLFAIGVGGSFRLTKGTRFNVEYYPVLNRPSSSANVNVLSACFDIETGGHVFQLVFSNSQHMVENQFVPGTSGKWSKGDVYFGFNLLRFFSFDKKRAI